MSEFHSPLEGISVEPHTSHGSSAADVAQAPELLTDAPQTPEKPGDVSAPPGVTPGRCGSCRFARDYDLPLGTVTFCRRFIVQMDQESKEAVRDCSGWEYSQLRELLARRRESKHTPMMAEAIADEDRLFAALQNALEHHGLDLKTLLLLAQPALSSFEDLDWIDDLPEAEEDRPLSELVVQLRERRYDMLAGMLEPFILRSS